MKRWFSLSFFLLIFLLISVLWLLPQMGTPSHNRNWDTPYVRTPDALVTTSTVTLTNVRNFNHNTETTFSHEWKENVTIPIADVTAVWFGLARFNDSKLTGHSFLSFELASGTVYTLSIEARREVGETYNIVSGLFNEFELWYGWGTERDFLGVSMFTLNRPLEYYRLNLTPAEAQAVFRSVSIRTHEVAKHPVFYNTLTANCTNLLAKAINEQYPGRVPYHLAWNLPARAPQFFQKEKLVDDSIGVATLRQRVTIDSTDPKLTATIETTPDAFSQVLREQLTQ
ncbi:DUF4105 domain-containing protein, partial [Candidatus Kaiserbacteria bacterium]|nr:DUF4105 domain-containing protein [Candidatus Kaiserbacteria bacterium]